ncbi:MAG: rhomboid family intramembrane serine protease [Bacilli bacterium]|nr:rhomboid family intramembrane serine protease [Bacilli bacterium]
MSSLNLTKIDEITMRLIHYFITKENYQPIVVKGLDNEIWLENIEKPYKVIRISSNYIHNNEQLDYDIFKTKAVVKQIKRKMLSFKTNTLNILLNVGDNVNVDKNVKNMEYITVNNVSELTEKSKVLELFPALKNDEVEGSNDMDFFLNVTQDINESTEKKNKLYEKTFKKKRIVVTYALIVLNIIIYFLSMSGIIDLNLFAMNGALVSDNHEWWRIITSMFFHGSIIHLFCNMYSLYVIGVELETVIGKWKFMAVYLISGIVSSLLSGVINGELIYSIGASGAIFGLMASLLYFGNHYRLYLSNIMTHQLVPIILINLAIGFSLPYIDNWAHIGGLVGGLFSSMIVGIEGKTDKKDTINGIILTTILIVFLIFMLFNK